MLGEPLLADHTEVCGVYATRHPYSANDCDCDAHDQNAPEDNQHGLTPIQWRWPIIFDLAVRVCAVMHHIDMNP